MWGNADADANVKPDGIGDSDVGSNSDSNPHGCGHKYSYTDAYRCLTHTDMCGRQSIRDNGDRR